MHKELEEGEFWALLDCDDVLLDYIDGFSVFLTQRLGREVSGRPDSWDLEKWMGVDKEKVFPLMSEFNDKDPNFGNLKPIEGALDGVRKLRSLGFKIAIITSSSEDLDSKKRRQLNINNVFGSLVDALHIVPLGKSKSDILQRYENAIWIEDNLKNAELGASFGHRAFLLLASHNQGIHGKAKAEADVLHVKSWTDILDKVQEIMPIVNNKDLDESGLNF